MKKKKNDKTHETLGERDHPTISVCLIDKNERKHVNNCLAICENISHELIVANIGLPDCSGIHKDLKYCKTNRKPFSEYFMGNYSCMAGGHLWNLLSN